MDKGLATQLVTVGATLGGVVLTLVANALLERRRARETHRLEELRLVAEHTKWLRDERTRAYAAFSLAGEEVLQFLRTLAGRLGEPDHLPANWQELRTELRKAYNQVLLLGAEEPRTIALRVWRRTRDSTNDLLGDIAGGGATPEAIADRSSAVRAAVGSEVNNFLSACRTDLQGG